MSPSLFIIVEQCTRLSPRGAFSLGMNMCVQGGGICVFREGR